MSFFCLDSVINKILKVFKDEGYEISEEEIELIKNSYDINSLRNSLEEIETYEFTISEYEEVPKDEGVFLTHEAAITHLKNNEYHYEENAHTYAKTAWRSTEEMLWKILQTIDFEQLN